MNKVLLLVGMMLVVAVVSGCAEFDKSTYRSDDYRYGGGSSGGGHSHH